MLLKNTVEKIIDGVTETYTIVQSHMDAFGRWWHTLQNTKTGENIGSFLD